MKKTHALFAFVSLIVLLTAGAAQSLSGTNTVDSGDIIDGQVKFADIKPDAVTSSRIRTDAVGASEIQADQVGASELADNSVGSANIIDGTVTSADITNGQVNTTDLAGGAVRASDLGTITERTSTGAVCANGNSCTASVQCLAGEVVLSGGGNGSVADVDMTSTLRTSNGWFVFLNNNSGGNATATARAYCLAS
jgi:hypothetical protein